MESIQDSFERWSLVNKCKETNSKLLWLHKENSNASNNKIQTLKRFIEVATVLKKTLTASQKKFFHQEAKSFFMLLSNSKNTPKKFHKTNNRKAGNRSVKTVPILKNDKKIILKSLTVNVDTFNKNVFDSAATVGGPSRRECKEFIKSIIKTDDNNFV